MSPIKKETEEVAKRWPKHLVLHGHLRVSFQQGEGGGRGPPAHLPSFLPALHIFQKAKKPSSPTSTAPHLLPTAAERAGRSVTLAAAAPSLPSSLLTTWELLSVGFLGISNRLSLRQQGKD